jgi:nucleoside-diphosphate-sugar epimerase
MKSAFVTGGSGFVGRELIAELVRRGIAVRALARSEAASAAVTKAGATPVIGDLDDQAAMTAGMTGADVVFHAAAYVKQHGPRDDFYRINVGGTERALAAAKAAGVKRFVHVGTEAVLADGKPIVNADEARPRAAKPAGLYPLTKGLAEAAVIAANTAGGLETVVVRPRFIWGKGDTSLLPELTETVKRGRFGWIGGGRFLTSTCHVRNVVEGALLAADKGAPGEIYFLSDGEPVEMRAFLTAYLGTQGVDAGTRNVPRWVARAAAALTGWMKQPPVTRTAIALVGVEVTVDDRKARRELGYAAHVSREAGLAEMRGDRATAPAAP